MKKLLIAFSTIALVGCFTSKPPKQAPPAPAAAEAVVPAPSDVEMAQAKFPNYTLEELNQGKTLYQQNCGTCHGLKTVTSFTEAEWNQIVPDMCRKVNNKGPALDADAQAKILHYVVAVSNASR